MNHTQAKEIAKPALDYLMNLKEIDSWWKRLPPTVRTQIRRGLARAIIQATTCLCKDSFWRGEIIHRSICTKCDKPLARLGGSEYGNL